MAHMISLKRMRQEKCRTYFADIFDENGNLLRTASGDKVQDIWTVTEYSNSRKKMAVRVFDSEWAPGLFISKLKRVRIVTADVNLSFHHVI